MNTFCFDLTFFMIFKAQANLLLCTSHPSSNLLQEKDYDQAERYSDLAMNADRYNPAALINKGNTLFVKQDYEKAAEFYKEALRNDSSCTEAVYNLGNARFYCKILELLVAEK